LDFPRLTHQVLNTWFIGSEFSSDTKTPAQPQSVTGLESYPPAVALQDQPPTSGASIHPLDAQSDLSSAQTARRADEMEPEEDEENQELTDEQLKRLYDDEEIERFLKVFAKASTLLFRLY
jgi:hypothetical protein